VNDSFLTFVQEQFSFLGPIRIKKMFGGAGIYCNDLIFGIIVDDAVYLKADASTKNEFEALGMEPFSYEAKGNKKVSMSYYHIPEDYLEDPSELAIWAHKALDAAVRGTTKKKKKKKKNPKQPGT